MLGKKVDESMVTTGMLSGLHNRKEEGKRRSSVIGDTEVAWHSGNAELYRSSTEKRQEDVVRKETAEKRKIKDMNTTLAFLRG